MKGIFQAVGLVVLSVLGLTMCTKEDPVRKYKIEQETRQWTAFKQGSYWVYEMEGTNEKDSTYVVLYRETETSGIDESGNKFLEQHIDIKFANNYGYFNTKVDNVLPRGNSLKISMLDKVGLPLSSVDMILVFPLSFNSQTNTPYFSIISESDKVALDKEVLNNVVHVKCSVNGLGGILKNTTYENEYWIARNKWIVKMKVKNCQTGNMETWSLKRYKVVQ